MKKNFVATLLVAILASSMVFAGFSGNANVALGYNTETGAFGFSNGTGFDVEVDLTTADAEAIAEGDIYAGIKASMAFKLANWKNKPADYPDNSNKGNGIWSDTKNGDYGIGLFLEVAEAYVAGENWKVSITGTQGAPDYAKSMLATKKDAVNDIFGNKYDEKDVEDSYAVASKKVAGVTVEAFGWKGSVGFAGNSGEGSVKTEDKFYEFNGFIETPVFDFDGVTLQAAAIASRDVTNDTITSRFSGAAGVSAKVGFTTDVVTGSVAADYGIKKVSDKYYNGFDAVANLAIDPVTLEVYYQNKDFSVEDNNLLSAKVVTDLASFDVPVKLTVTGKDLIRKQDLSAEVAFTIDAFEITVKGGYVIDSKKVSAGAAVAYKTDMFTAKAGADYSTTIETDNTNRFWATASVETEALIPGAKLALTYGAGDNDMNFLKDQATVQNFGKVEAKCTISF